MQSNFFNTYEKNTYVDKNEFIGSKQSLEKVPTYEEVCAKLPKPIFDGHADYINCYDFAWKIAFKNIGSAKDTKRFISNFIKTAFNGCLFMWDTSFIMMFTKYANNCFDFQKTLDNFYALQHKNGFICREIEEISGNDRFSMYDPSSTGPNIMAWAEWCYYETFNDIERLKKVYFPLRAFHNWFRKNRTWRDGSYYSSGWGCGMDNLPRLQSGEHENYSHGHMVWVDTTLQQVLNCNILIKMNKVLNVDNVSDLIEESKELSKLINEKLWDKTTKFYYDLYRNGELNMVKHVGAYWALIAKVVDKDKIESFISHLLNVSEFNRLNGVPALSADHSLYDGNGGYWRGGVWAPTNYMVLKGLTANGYDSLAYDIASKYLNAVVKVYNETGTLWENYAPDYIKHGNQAHQDFVGWTGLVPISVFIEYVLGIQVNCAENKIIWRVNHTERHGITNLPFGKGNNVDLVCNERTSLDEEPEILIKSTSPVEVLVIYNGKEKLIKA